MGNVLNTTSQKRPCTGCGVCSAACPFECITIVLDADGFFRPEISDACTQCGLCVRSCVKFEESKQTEIPFFSTKQIYSYKNTNREALLSASSGGVVDAICRIGLKNGYKISGAVYSPDENIVKHIVTNSIGTLNLITGSKYLQSYTQDALKQIKTDKTQKCIIIGTPCQIYGIGKWAEINKFRDKLILIDFFCAGVPSYDLWESYLQYIEDRYHIGDITRVNFRDKESGWHQYGMRIDGKEGTYYMPNATSNDLFYRLFLSDSCKQSSCCLQNCPFRTSICASDIRVGDFWGEKYQNDNSGVSVVIANTTEGAAFLENLPTLQKETSFTVGQLRNPHPKRHQVMEALKNGEKITDIIKMIDSKSITSKLIHKLKNLIYAKK